MVAGGAAHEPPDGRSAPAPTSTLRLSAASAGLVMPPGLGSRGGLSCGSATVQVSDACRYRQPAGGPLGDGVARYRDVRYWIRYGPI